MIRFEHIYKTFEYGTVADNKQFTKYANDKIIEKVELQNVFENFLSVCFNFNENPLYFKLITKYKMKWHCILISLDIKTWHLFGIIFALFAGLQEHFCFFHPLYNFHVEWLGFLIYHISIGELPTIDGEWLTCAQSRWIYFTTH